MRSLLLVAALALVACDETASAKSKESVHKPGWVISTFVIEDRFPDEDGFAVNVTDRGVVTVTKDGKPHAYYFASSGGEMSKVAREGD